METSAAFCIIRFAAFGEETMKQALLWILTAALAALSFYYARFSNFNFGNLCVWVLAALSFVYALFWRHVDAWLLHTLPGRVLLGLLAAGVVFFCAVLGVVLSGQFGAHADGSEKAIVVLGCAVKGHEPSLLLTYRLEAALSQWKTDPEAVLVVCGGQGRGELEPEGRVMARWLLARGVPAEKVLVDDTSTSTEENFRNAKALLEEAGLDAAVPTAFVTNGFHCWRAAQYARAQGFGDCRAVPAGLPLTQIPTCYIREVFAVVYYWAFKSPNRGLMGKLVGFLWLGAR